MNVNDIPPDISKHLAGPVGSAIALLWLPGSLPRRIAQFLAGWGSSHYAGPALVSYFGMSETFAGFITGLLAVHVVSKLFETWTQFDAGTLLKDAVRSFFKLDKEAPK